MIAVSLEMSDEPEIQSYCTASPFRFLLNINFLPLQQSLTNPLFMATSFGFQLATSSNKKVLYPVVLRITQDRKQKKVDTELLKKVLKKLDVSGIRIEI